MTIYTLPGLARAIGVSYAVVYTLRTRGYLTPTQVNGSREYYTIDDYRAAAAQSVEEWNEKRKTLSQPRKQQPERNAHNRIDYDALYANL